MSNNAAIEGEFMPHTLPILFQQAIKHAAHPLSECNSLPAPNARMHSLFPDPLVAYLLSMN